jgi:hypothetical protein
MKVTDAIGKIEESKEYSKWLKENPQAYLAHAFTMKEKEGFESWQVGYYNPGRNMVTVFELDDTVKMMPESEVFKKDETPVKALDRKQIILDVEQALEAAIALGKDKYPQIRSDKQIIVLQNLDEGQVWNITFISPSMDVLNIKLSSDDGKIISHNLSRIFDFKNFDDNNPIAG